MCCCQNIAIVDQRSATIESAHVWQSYQPRIFIRHCLLTPIIHGKFHIQFKMYTKFGKYLTNVSNVSIVSLTRRFVVHNLFLHTLKFENIQFTQWFGQNWNRFYLNKFPNLTIGKSEWVFDTYCICTVLVVYHVMVPGHFHPCQSCSIANWWICWVPFQLPLYSLRLDLLFGSNFLL